MIIIKKYLYNYIDNIDKVLESKNINYDEVKNNLLIKINFFQHERLVNLLIVLFYFVFTIMFICLSTTMPLFLIISVLLLLFLIFYVINYFKIESGVQYLYMQYDKLMKLCNKL